MRRKINSRCIWVAPAVLGLSLLAGSGLHAQSLLDEAYTKFRQGDSTAAKAKLEEALLKGVDANEAFSFIEKIEYSELLRMLRDKDLNTAAAALERIVSTETRRRSMDADMISAVLDKYFSTDDIIEEHKTVYRMVNEHGVYLMPGLIEALSSSEQEIRVRGIKAIVRLSEDAIVPLSVASTSDNPQIQLGVISAMSGIHSLDCLPTLKAIAETAADTTIKGAALDAMEGISPGKSSHSAYDMLATQSHRFYNDADYLSRTHHDPISWSMDGNKLMHASVHAWAVNELRAQFFITRALSLSPQNVQGTALAASIDLAQWAEYIAVRDSSQRQLESGNMDEAAASKLRAEEPRLQRVRNRAYMAGSNVLYQALEGALRDERPEVAIETLSALKSQIDTTSGRRASAVPNILSEAQAFPHRGVRFGASEVIAFMNPAAEFNGSNLVLENLNEGMVEAGGRLALMMFSDESLANELAGKLRVGNVAAFNETKALTALSRARSYPHDVLILSANLETLNTAEMIALLRKDARTKSTPIFVIASQDRFESTKATYEAAAEGVTVISENVDPARLRDDFLAALFEGKDDARSRSALVAVRAAEAIKFLAQRDSVFATDSSAQALITVLENRPASVRIPACGAIAALGISSAQPSLVRLLDDSSVKAPLKIAALKAIGAINRDNGSVTPDVAELLKKHIGDSDLNIAQAAASAMGTIGVTRATHKE